VEAGQIHGVERLEKKKAVPSSAGGISPLSLWGRMGNSSLAACPMDEWIKIQEDEPGH